MDVDRVLDLMAWGREHVSLDTPVDEDGDTSLGDLMAQETSPGPDLDGARRRVPRPAQRPGRACSTSGPPTSSGRATAWSTAASTSWPTSALKHGISAERVRQLEREALQKLRRLGDPDLAA